MTRAVTLSQIALETGFSARYWRAKAAAGQMPGAVQPSGEGGGWRVDYEEFKPWWNAQKRRKPWLASTNGSRRQPPGARKKSQRAVGPIGADVSVPGLSVENPLRQRIASLRKSAFTRG